jgi:hypothetical protein
MTNEQIVEVLQKCRYYFNNNDMVIDLFRWLGWVILKGLNYLSTLALNLFNACYDFLDFTAWSGINDFLIEFKPLIIALMVASITFLGWMIANQKVQKSSIYMRNFIIFILIFVSSAGIFSWLNTFAIGFKDIMIEGENGIEENNLMKDYLYDLIYLDEKLGGYEALTPEIIKNNTYDNLTNEEISLIDINEVINYKRNGLSASAKAVLAKILIYDNAGANKLIDVYTGFGFTNNADSENFLNRFYYRYQYNFLEAVLAYMAYILVLFGVSFKVLKNIIEIIFGRITMAFRSIDMSSGEKTVEIIQSIAGAYVMIMACVVTIKIYLLITEYIKSSENLSDEPILRSVILLMVGIILFRGSSILNQATGAKGGDGAGGLVSTFIASKMLKSISRKAGSIGRNLGFGAKDAMNQIKNNYNNSNSGNSGNSAMGMKEFTKERSTNNILKQHEKGKENNTDTNKQSGSMSTKRELNGRNNNMKMESSIKKGDNPKSNNMGMNKDKPVLNKNNENMIRGNKNKSTPNYKNETNQKIRDVGNPYHDKTDYRPPILNGKMTQELENIGKRNKGRTSNSSSPRFKEE